MALMRMCSRYVTQCSLGFCILFLDPTVAQSVSHLDICFVLCLPFNSFIEVNLKQNKTLAGLSGIIPRSVQNFLIKCLLLSLV